MQRKNPGIHGLFQNKKLCRQVESTKGFVGLRENGEYAQNGNRNRENDHKMIKHGIWNLVRIGFSSHPQCQWIVKVHLGPVPKMFEDSGGDWQGGLEDTPRFNHQKA